MLLSILSSRRKVWPLAALLTAAALFAILSARSGRARRSAAVVHRARATRATSATAPSGRAAAEVPPQEDERLVLGRKMFFDASLSVPEGTSCASCHDPAHGFAGNNGSTVGVAQGSRHGRFARRNTPSVLYLRFVRRLHLVWDDDAERPEAYGGFFWDGRSSSIASLVQQPLLSPDEMGNRDLRQIAEKLARAPYADDLRAVFDDVFATPEKTVEALGFCLEAFLTSRALSPFSSRYDDFVRGTARLTELEMRGLALFQNPEKGACSSCHRLDPASHEPARSMFTDYGYDAVAAPRNRALHANDDPRHFDLGLCERHDPKLHTDDEWFCGSFRTPSLRNVALRGRFMHNGVFSSLHDVVAFYATRSNDPGRWYPRGEFDDLPPKLHRYVNTTSPPYDRPEGDPPALDEAEIEAVVAFLGTLSDRVVPAGTVRD
ncbi:MAG TPA: cytochrome c peroxidase [Polyangiaceae bacterium]|nr:cytochrome c peroxidase [Polyangiaceae bacterium]